MLVHLRDLAAPYVIGEFQVDMEGLQKVVCDSPMKNLYLALGGINVAEHDTYSFINRDIDNTLQRKLEELPCITGNRQTDGHVCLEVDGDGCCCYR